MVNSINNDLKEARRFESLGQIEAAEQIYLKIVNLYSLCHEAYFNLALLNYQRSHFEQSYFYLKSAISIRKDIGIYHRNFCEISRRLGKFEESINSGVEASKLIPNDIDVHFNLGLAYLDIKDKAGIKLAFTNIIRLIESGLDLKKKSWEIFHFKGFSYHRLNLFFDAKNAFEEAIKLNPQYADAYNSLGCVLRDMHHLKKALDCFAKALLIRPSFDIARLNLGMMQLQLGYWKEGWINYESRWTGSAESNTSKFLKPICPLPVWDISLNSQSKKILIFFEQGYGDMIQFSRYLILISQLFESVTYLCLDPAMHTLLEYSFKNQAQLLKKYPNDFSEWDYHCNLLSLPKAFSTEVDQIPDFIPYIRSSEERVTYWKKRLDEVSKSRLKIGIAWSGRPTHLYDHRRSLMLEQILPLISVNDVCWVSLQKNYNYQSSNDMSRYHWIDWSNELIDFSETAALVSNLDLVISVDSSMIHLSGALGKPTWMLNRYDSEWRWLYQKMDSPWYKSLRIFNQPCFGDWVSVIESAKNNLYALLESK